MARVSRSLLQIALLVCLCSLRGTPLIAQEPATPDLDIEALRAQAEAGDAIAQCNLGVMYAKGIGVPKDAAAAVKWYTLTAEAGNARAQCNLGVMYEKGIGVPKDAAAAVKWYTLTAEAGNARAQCNLGVMYEKGIGVPKDAAAAVKWYTLTAELHNEIRAKSQAQP